MAVVTGSCRCEPHIPPGLTSPSGSLSEAQVEIMLESQVPSHVILCPSDKTERLLFCEQRRVQCGDVWEQAQKVGKSCRLFHSYHPRAKREPVCTQMQAARALLLVVSKGSNLKFNLQKSQGTWPEEMSFSSQVLSDGRNYFFLQVLSHFHILTTLFKSCPHNNITPTTSIFSAGTKKDTHSHLAADECWKEKLLPHCTPFFYS